MVSRVYWKHVASGVLQVVDSMPPFLREADVLGTKISKGVATDQRFGIYLAQDNNASNCYKFDRYARMFKGVLEIPDELRLFILLSEEANDG